MDIHDTRQAFMHPRQTRSQLVVVFQKLIDAKRLTIALLADVTSVDYSTARRWTIGEQIPDAHEIGCIARADSIDVEARIEILSVSVVLESPLNIGCRSETLSARGLPDAVRSSLEAACASTAMAKRVAEVAQDRIVTPEEAADVRELVNRLRVEADTVLQVIDRTCTAPRMAS